MSTESDYTSGSYFDRLQVQLELNVVSQFSGIMGNSAQNASQGVSASISAVDTGIKAAMALSGALASGIESAYLPALGALGLSGMACLPISKQLDPVVGVDCHIMILGGTPSYGLLGYRYPHSAPEQEECGLCGIVPTHRRYHPYPLGKAYSYQSYPDSYQSRSSSQKAVNGFFCPIL